MIPTGGVKAAGYGIPTPAERRALDRAVEVIRVRYQRWTRRRMASILASTRDEILALDEPDEAGFLAAVMRHDDAMRSTLTRMLREVYPSAAAIAVPDDVIKGWTVYETKAVDQRLWDLVEKLVGRSITAIDDTTLRHVRQAYIQSQGDVEAFRRLLLQSPAFSPARARTIAVTETNVAINDSIYTASEELDRDRERIMVWCTTLRLNVRETHQMMEGQIVPFGEFFHVPLPKGGYDLMLHPGDTLHGAHPENFINCFCKGFPRYVA